MPGNSDFKYNKKRNFYFTQKLRDRPYNYDQTLLKVFGYGENKKIKLVRMNFLKTSGIEMEDIKHIKSIRGTINKNKIEESYLRSKTKIFELAFCNPWDWFFTGTINPNKQDRTDLDLFHKQLTQWIRDYNKKYSLSIKFLLVPEKHKDGKSWHIHRVIIWFTIKSSGAI